MELYYGKQSDLYNKAKEVKSYDDLKSLASSTLNKITETYKNKSCYKFILHRSDKYDIVHIKWEKDFQSDKHQHLKFDNVMYVINDGCLVEHIFKYCNFYDIFIRYTLFIKNPH